MKTLLLLRHAKSSWGDAALKDFDRPLARRGLGDAPRMGRALSERGPAPDLVISSPAARARQTVELFLESSGYDLAPRFDGSIYDASAGELMQLVRELPDSAGCVLLVGHNPGFEYLASRLAASQVTMPTAALACIELPVEKWEDVEEDHGRLVWHLVPKELQKRGEEKHK
jgi:phosphohistidine phosphatase